MDLEVFSRRIRVRGTEIVELSDTTVRRLALAADQTLVSATPVDTGRARSNWMVQLGSASSETRDPMPEGQLLSEAAATISAYRSTPAGPGPEIHITNNLPYIQRLNEGHSAQAPAAFVEQAIQVAYSAVRKAKFGSGG